MNPILEISFYHQPQPLSHFTQIFGGKSRMLKLITRVAFEVDRQCLDKHMIPIKSRICLVLLFKASCTMPNI